MRLLEYDDVGNFKLTGDLAHDIPKYAILSHTWGPDTEEVTFRDLVDGTGEGKIGYKKIRFCAEQARRDGLQYFWVDTCCIDKSNNTELSTAINSMFRWYQNAARCYVYLADIKVAGCGDGQQSGLAWELEFRTHRWFTRGWTLQELIAPSSVEFFMQDGRRLGDKKSLEQQIHEITGIEKSALRGRDLSQFDIDKRFKWAATRRTTHEEDWAYCLMGIFGVYIPLLYGEGKDNAVRRLRKEIDGDMSRKNPPNSRSDLSELSRHPTARGAGFDSHANEQDAKSELPRPIRRQVQCSKCREYGHKADNVHCYKCGEYGHYSNDHCYKCGEYGHYSKDHCDKCGEYGHYDDDIHCYKCGEYGHYSNDHCYKCDKYGHYAVDCSLR